jgi:hypothetical protein
LESLTVFSGKTNLEEKENEFRGEDELKTGNEGQEPEGPRNNRRYDPAMFDIPRFLWKGSSFEKEHP